ncbi:MAG: phage tail protein [Deltaproteobacteria bacterium]|nr:phage tail protein [Deltaproteobacteria bacterium]
MSLEIRFEHDFGKIPVFLDRLKARAVLRSVKRSLNRTIEGVRTQANVQVRQERKLKASEINQNYFRVDRARSYSLQGMEALLSVSTKPIPLLPFVLGSQEPAIQKGIAIRERKPLRAEIQPGRRQQLPHAFIARVRSKQVFRRKDPGRSPLMKQSIPPLTTLFQRKEFLSPLERYARERYGKEFSSNFNFELSKWGIS